jgi:sphingomyelin phosphodiesterase 2
MTGFKQLCCKLIEDIFSSGFIGSGLCFFSKHEFIDVKKYRYSVNGAPYKYKHGDWYAGKSAGLVKIKHNNLTINIYNTHVMAKP